MLRSIGRPRFYAYHIDGAHGHCHRALVFTTYLNGGARVARRQFTDHDPTPRGLCRLEQRMLHSACRLLA